MVQIVELHSDGSEELLRAMRDITPSTSYALAHPIQPLSFPLSSSRASINVWSGEKHSNRPPWSGSISVGLGDLRFHAKPCTALSTPLRKFSVPRDVHMRGDADVSQPRTEHSSGAHGLGRAGSDWSAGSSDSGSSDVARRGLPKYDAPVGERQKRRLRLDDSDGGVKDVELALDDCVLEDSLTTPPPRAKAQRKGDHSPIGVSRSLPALAPCARKRFREYEIENVEMNLERLQIRPVPKIRRGLLGSSLAVPAVIEAPAPAVAPPPLAAAS